MVCPADIVPHANGIQKAYRRLGALHRHVKRYGPEAARDFTEEPVTAQWRIQHVLVPTVLKLDGPLIDLTDVPTRQEIEDRHVELLLEHKLEHLDLPPISEAWLENRCGANPLPRRCSACQQA
jgi:hypothetical protein